MKRAFLIAGFCLIAAPAVADDVCRSVSTSWQQDGHSLQTRISTQAENGCKLIWQSVDGAETAGVDCNCDLVIDGMEARFSPPPSGYQSERLLKTCHGPSTVPKSAEAPVIVTMQPGPQQQVRRIIYR